MKRFIVIAIGLLAVASLVTYAKVWSVDDKQPPPIALPYAYQLAVKALGAATNDYHCTSAQVIGAECRPASWLFTFVSTNGAKQYVFACANGQTRVMDRLIL